MAESTQIGVNYRRVSVEVFKRVNRTGNVDDPTSIDKIALDAV